MSNDTNTELSELSDEQLAQHLRQCAMPLINELNSRGFLVEFSPDELRAAFSVMDGKFRSISEITITREQSL